MKTLLLLLVLLACSAKAQTNQPFAAVNKVGVQKNTMCGPTFWWNGQANFKPTNGAVGYYADTNIMTIQYTNTSDRIQWVGQDFTAGCGVAPLHITNNNFAGVGYRFTLQSNTNHPLPTIDTLTTIGFTNQ